MKNILCYGDSNTWGCVPLDGYRAGAPVPAGDALDGRLAARARRGHWIVEEGLNGRTTVFEDPFEPHRNGRELLLPALLTHRPLDLVVVMLGTNDLKHRINATASDIAEGAGMLADIVAASGCGRDEGAPQTLLVCPAAARAPRPASTRLRRRQREVAPAAQRLRGVAEARACAFLDAGAVISSSDVDGIHLDEPEHERLGVAIAEHVRPLLA